MPASSGADFATKANRLRDEATFETRKRTVQRLTQTVLSVAAATLLFVRREAIPGYFGPHNRSFVGLHSPDTDPFWSVLPSMNRLTEPRPAQV